VLREVLSRLDVIEERRDHFGKEQAAQRREMGELRREMNERFDRMNGAMRVQKRWAVGTIALFDLIVTVLPAVAQRTA
jgi:hypothetical protein